MTIPDPLPKLQLSSSNFTLMHYLPRDDHDDFDLSAPYQRGSVWSVEQRQALIKSLLIGVPIGAVTLSIQGHRSDTYYRVVDGKQRIESVRAFVSGEFPVPGWWFVERHLSDPKLRTQDVSGMDLSNEGRMELKLSSFPAVEFKGGREFTYQEDGSFTSRKRTPDEMLQAEAELYLLINFGGVEQTEEDAARAAKVAGLVG